MIKVMLLISAIVFFSLTSFAQKSETTLENDTASQRTRAIQDSIVNMPVLSYVDLQKIVNAIDYLPARDWKKVAGIMEQYFQSKMNAMQPKKITPKEKPKK